MQPTIEVESDGLAGEESDEPPFKIAQSSSFSAAKPQPREIQLTSNIKMPFKRPQENQEEIDPQLCKDAEGNWTKWVIERLDDKEMTIFNQFKDLIVDKPIASSCSVNKQLRTLVSCKWNAKSAAQSLIDA